MPHRHMNTTEWTLAAIDSTLERGDLADWRELFAAVRRDRAIAAKVLRVTESHDVGGATTLARELVLRMWNDLASH
jgi:hypothetical protein